MEYYIDLIRFANIGILVFVAIGFFNARENSRFAWIGSVFVLSVICYLMIDWGGLNHLMFYSFYIGATSVSYLFWLLTISIFDDYFKPKKIHLFIYFLTIAIYFTLHFIDNFGFSNGYLLHLISEKLSRIISMAFIVLGIAEAYSGKEADLIESRIKFRLFIIYAIGIIIFLTLIVEITIDLKPYSNILSIYQKLYIFILTIVFSSQMFELRSDFFPKKSYRRSSQPESNDAVLQTLMTQIEVEHVYLQEKLTIRKLANQMNVQEYKLRRVINLNLGFKNFNDFLNTYRIQKACEMLLDEKDAGITVIEISYKLGYSSIGPFNKAFKQHTGTTPSNYRKNLLLQN